MDKPQECSGCSFESTGQGWSRAEGYGNSGVAIIGEGCGHQEMIDSLPFRPFAPSGSLLEKAFRLVGVPRSAFILDNIIRCHPPSDDFGKVKSDAIQHCNNVFGLRSLGHGRVRCILAVGGNAFKTITGLSGKRLGVSNIRGYVLPSVLGGYAWGSNLYTPVVASYHPSYIRQSGKLAYLDYLIHDLKRALAVAKGAKPNVVVRYVEHPSLDELWRFYDSCEINQDIRICYDIETEETEDVDEDEREAIGGRITSIQFSREIGTGLFVDLKNNSDNRWREVVQAILGLPNPKIGHNVWNFDNRILRDHGYSVAGDIDDTMWLFHHLRPDLEMNLQSVASFTDMPFPWKHYSGERPEFYGCADVDAPLRIYAKLIPTMKAIGVLRGYEAHVRGIYKIQLGASDRGMGVNAEAHNELETNLEQLRMASLSALQSGAAGSGVGGMHPKEGYKREPPEVACYREPYDTLVEQLAASGRTAKPFEQAVSAKVAESSLRPAKPDSDLMKHLVYRSFNGDSRWAWQLEFNPGSWQQLQSIIRLKGDKVPKKSDGKETTEAKELERLARSSGDRFYDEIIAYRQYTKMLGNDVPNWRPGKDGAVHTTFTFAPATGQLSSRNPNVQNCSRRSVLGQRFRQIIQARPGRVLVELDFSGFHAMMLGREAQSRAYMDLAACDAHSWFASYLVNKPVDYSLYERNPQEFRDKLREIKAEYGAVRDFQAKPALLGIGLGLQPRKLYWLNRSQEIEGKTVGIPNEKTAKRLIGMLKELRPELFEYQDRIVDLAARKACLMNAWAFIRWFYDTKGEDRERAIAFNVQGNAHGMLKAKLIEMNQLSLLDRFWYINTIHDSVLFEPLEDEAEECIELVRDVMQSPCLELADSVVCPEGLRVGVEVTRGYNWGKWSAENPRGMRRVQ